MKPRITVVPACGPYGAPRSFLCHGSGVFGTGKTPEASYGAWVQRWRLNGGQPRVVVDNGRRDAPK